MSSPGWIKLHRLLLDNPNFKDPGWLSVWCYLNLSCNHRPGETRMGSKRWILNPGMIRTSKAEISRATGLDQTKVWRILQSMEQAGDIAILERDHNHGSLIAITNWEMHQRVHPKK